MYKGGHVYVMTNKNKTVLYIGVTANLPGRIYQHKEHLIRKSFSDRYNLEFLIYYEEFDGIEEAIAREKQLKKLSRKRKEDLINSMNPHWVDLHDKMLDELLP